MSVPSHENKFMGRILFGLTIRLPTQVCKARSHIPVDTKAFAKLTSRQNNPLQNR